MPLGDKMAPALDGRPTLSESTARSASLAGRRVRAVAIAGSEVKVVEACGRFQLGCGPLKPWGASAIPEHPDADKETWLG